VANRTEVLHARARVLFLVWARKQGQTLKHWDQVYEQVSSGWHLDGYLHERGPDGACLSCGAHALEPHHRLLRKVRNPRYLVWSNRGSWVVTDRVTGTTRGVASGNDWETAMRMAAAFIQVDRNLQDTRVPE
jgi:hypothetical protein